MTGRFTRGDHLQIWRSVGRIGYYHHGIYISDERVIQFGRGIRGKRSATVCAVSLEKFECGGTAKVVPHRGRTWWGAPRFEEIPREKTVLRAERLAATHPEGLYDLFGYNCEQAANFCSTNSYESYQVRGFFTVRAIIGWPFGLYVAKRYREERPFSPAVTKAVIALYALLMATNVLYHVRGARFMKKVGRPLLAWERSLAEERKGSSANQTPNERAGTG